MEIYELMKLAAVIWCGISTPHRNFRRRTDQALTAGSRSGSGPAIVSGMVLYEHGYTDAMAGNVLLAFPPTAHSAL
jgi:hypothetical protein